MKSIVHKQGHTVSLIQGTQNHTLPVWFSSTDIAPAVLKAFIVQPVPPIGKKVMKAV